MTAAMKSCPFCGGEGRVIPDPGNRYRSNILYRPQCDRCGGGLGGFDTSAFAVEAWNRRAPADAELEEMTLGRMQTAIQATVHSAALSNLRDAHAAMQLIREAVETLGPVGCMRSSEYVTCAVAPTFDAEAREIIAGIQRMAGPSRI